MAAGISVHAALKTLRSASVLTDVWLTDWDADRRTAIFRGRPASVLKQPFVEKMTAICAATADAVPDEVWSSVLKSLLADHLPADLVFFVDVSESFDPGAPDLPETIHLEVDLAGGERPKGHGRATRPPQPMDDTVAEVAPEERTRSRRRRANARRKAIESDTYRPPGKTSYVRRVDLDQWEPTEEGRAVMEAADAVWKKGVDTFPALAAHLNAQKQSDGKNLTSLDGKPFTTKMMGRLVAQLELLRGSQAL